MSKIIIIGIQDYNAKEGKQPGALLHFMQNRSLTFKSDAGYQSAGNPVKGSVWVPLTIRGSLKVGAMYEAEFEVQGSGATMRESLVEVRYIEDVALPSFDGPLLRSLASAK